MAYTNQHHFFDDLQIGQKWESSERAITGDDVASFAGLSGDFNPMHMDHQFAAATPFRQPIAHGLLVQAVASGLGLSSPLVRTVAVISLKEWHYRLPVFFGDTIKVRNQVLTIEPKSRGRRGLVTWKREIINQEGKVVQEGVAETLVEGRGEKGVPANGPGE
ncbi:MAG: dehydratase [Gemmataceae bacterium]|nr:dehydratase [Gemmataceae bacterium]